MKKRKKNENKVWIYRTIAVQCLFGHDIRNICLNFASLNFDYFFLARIYFVEAET